MDCVPSGKVHESINLIAYASLATAYAYARQQGILNDYPAVQNFVTPAMLKTFSLSFMLGTFLVTPDLDLAENRMRARNNWGLVGLLWVPYGAIFSHRGISHSWIIGPLTRLLYMIFIALALSWACAQVGPYLGYHFSLQAKVTENGNELAWGAALGYLSSQWIHLLADGIRPDHGVKKRPQRKRRRKKK